MEYTKNYHLPQWKEEDRIMMRDFNDAMMQLEKAIAEAGKPQCKTGTYVGNGKTMEEGGVYVELGFRPRMVSISRARISPSNTQTDITVGEGTVDGAHRYVTFLDNGFQVNYMETFDGYTALRLNNPDLVYSYVAFA